MNDVLRPIGPPPTIRTGTSITILPRLARERDGAVLAACDLAVQGQPLEVAGQGQAGVAAQAAVELLPASPSRARSPDHLGQLVGCLRSVRHETLEAVTAPELVL